MISFYLISNCNIYENTFDIDDKKNKGVRDDNNKKKKMIIK